MTPELFDLRVRIKYIYKYKTIYWKQIVYYALFTLLLEECYNEVQIQYPVEFAFEILKIKINHFVIKINDSKHVKE